MSARLEQGRDGTMRGASAECGCVFGRLGGLGEADEPFSGLLILGLSCLLFHN